jgi:hypothetical protein
VVTTGDPTWVDASTSSYPWGLLVVALVLLQIVVIAIVRRNRRARLARGGGADVGAPVDPTPAAGGDASVAAADDTPDEVDLTGPEPGAPEPAPVPAAAGAVGAASSFEREHAGGGRATATQDPTPVQPITAAPWTPRRGT